MNLKKMTSFLLSAVVGLGFSETAKFGSVAEYSVSAPEQAVFTKAQTNLLGDVNGDTMVDAGDASSVLAEYALLSTGGQSSFTDEQKKSADINADNMIDASDASFILSYYAYISTGGEASFEDMLVEWGVERGSSGTTTTGTTGTGTGTGTETAVTTTTASVTTSAVTDPSEVSEIKLSKSEVSVSVGYGDIVYVTMLPETATDKGEVWTSSDESIATVNEFGFITGVKAGTCTVTVASKSNPDVKADIKVTVKDPNQAGEIKLSKTEMNLGIGETDVSYATVLPEDATDKSVTWTSSDESIAKVDQGWITGLKDGTCTVTVTSNADPSVKAEVKVTVTDPNKVTGIEVSKTELEIGVGFAEQITAQVFPTDTLYKYIDWETSDKSIADVDQIGWIYGVKAGTCTITAMSQADHSIKAEVKVTVTDGSVTATETSTTETTETTTSTTATETTATATATGSATETATGTGTGTVSSETGDTTAATTTTTNNETTTTDTETTTTDTATTTTTATTTETTTATSATEIKVTEIKLTKTEMSIPVGNMDISYVTMLPENAPDKGEIWTSSDESIATVDQWGWVYGKKAGTCIVTVTSTSNPDVKAEIKVTITDSSADIKVTEIQLTKTEMSIPVGGTDISYVTMLPENAPDKGEIWTSSDESVATVDQYGWVYGVKAGTCTVTVTSTSNPSVKAEIKVTVGDGGTEVKVTEIQLTKTEFTIPTGGKNISYVTMLPENAPDKGEIWTSSDESVATVDQYGWIYGVKAGTCTVTVTSTSNPSVKAEIKVTVTDSSEYVKVTDILLSKTELTIQAGYGNISYVTMLPYDASDKSEIWTSSDESIATVDEYGWIYGVKAGTCTVTVTSRSNPDVKAEIKVTIID